MDQDFVSAEYATCSCLSDVIPNCLFTQHQMNTAEAIFRDCLGCTLLITALHQMRVPTDRDYRRQMKKSLKLSPGFAQKTTRDIMLHATLLFSFVL